MTNKELADKLVKVVVDKIDASGVLSADEMLAVARVCDTINALRDSAGMRCSSL